MPKDLQQNARQLRKQMTDAENRLWQALRREALGAKFRRQTPIQWYVLDFVCLERKLVIEVDGGQHADSAHDRERDRWLENQGFKVLRFWNPDVMNNLEGVLETIRIELAARPEPSKAYGAALPPTPALPHEGGGRP